jgi:hypothetical protein
VIRGRALDPTRIVDETGEVARFGNDERGPVTAIGTRAGGAARQPLGPDQGNTPAPRSFTGSSGAVVPSIGSRMLAGEVAGAEEPMVFDRPNGLST